MAYFLFDDTLLIILYEGWYSGSIGFISVFTLISAGEYPWELCFTNIKLYL